MQSIGYQYAYAYETETEGVFQNSDVATNPDERTRIFQIKRSTLPIKVTYSISTSKPDQTSFLLRIYEKTGATDFAADNLVLKQVRISDVQCKSVGEITLEITTEVDVSLHIPPNFVVRHQATEKVLYSHTMQRSMKCNASLSALSKLKLHISQENSLMAREIDTTSSK